MESSLIDVVLVVSLSFLAISFLIFMVFFIPVLMQTTRTLESVQSLVDLMKDYSVGISNEVQKVHHGLGNTMDNFSTKLHKFSDLLGGVFATVKDVVSSSRNSKSRW